jgi:hypothetical protein
MYTFDMNEEYRRRLNELYDEAVESLLARKQQEAYGDYLSHKEQDDIL